MIVSDMDPSCHVITYPDLTCQVIRLQILIVKKFRILADPDAQYWFVIFNLKYIKKNPKILATIWIFPNQDAIHREKPKHVKGNPSPESLPKNLNKIRLKKEMLLLKSSGTSSILGPSPLSSQSCSSCNNKLIMVTIHIVPNIRSSVNFCV